MKRFVALFLALATAMTVLSCEVVNPDPEPVINDDYGTIVSGVYTGKLHYGTETIEDAYVVRISRVSKTVVTMTAEFLDGSANFNVTKTGETYTLSSETVYNINTTIAGKQIHISYLTTGGYMFTFSGVKD